jgi:hypothetical protein
MADRGQSPAEISAAFMDQGLKRPIRDDLSKPLVDADLVVGRALDSWRSSRGIGLSVSRRLQYAASGVVFASPEELPSPEELEPVLQRRFAELVSRSCNEPGRVDYVPPQKSVVSGQARGDRRDEGKDTNTLVEEELGRNPGTTSGDISKATGIPESTVRRSRAWRDRPKTQAEDGPKGTDALDHSRPLTKPMLAAIASGAPDPAEIVADREEEDHNQAAEPIDRLQDRFFAEATDGQRARFHRLSPAERENDLKAWAITGEFLADERPAPGPLRERVRRPAERRLE